MKFKLKLKPSLMTILIVIVLLFWFLTKKSGFTPSASKGVPCNWIKFPKTGCDQSRGWCSTSNTCSLDYTQSVTYGRMGGVCTVPTDCKTSGAACNIVKPQVKFGTCSK